MEDSEAFLHISMNYQEQSSNLRLSSEKFVSVQESVKKNTEKIVIIRDEFFKPGLPYEL